MTKCTLCPKAGTHGDPAYPHVRFCRECKAPHHVLLIDRTASPAPLLPNPLEEQR